MSEKKHTITGLLVLLSVPLLFAAAYFVNALINNSKEYKNPPLPSAADVLGERQLAVHYGSYDWVYKKENFSYTAQNPSEVLQGESIQVFEPGENIYIDFEKKFASANYINMYIGDEFDTSRIIDGGSSKTIQLILSSVEGIYFYELNISFKQGIVNYCFAVEIKEPEVET